MSPSGRGEEGFGANSRGEGRCCAFMAQNPISVIWYTQAAPARSPMPLSPTAAQSEASRLNGARSSGPTTPEGKARSALNGTRHGLRGSTFSLLPDEDPAAWAAVLAGYLARFRPADEAELACVERLAACDWREGRLLRLETETLFAGRGEPDGPDPHLGWSRTLPRY